MKRLTSELSRKAEGLLRVYGGLEGLSRNPPWLVNMVLRTWFEDAERKQIVEVLLQGMKREVRVPLMREMGL